MRRRPAGTLVIATTVSGALGCVSLPPALPQETDGGACETPGVDGDGDGYVACGGAAPIDCDDTSAAIHPGARERCEDGVDQDCAGDPELACSDEVSGNTTSGEGTWTVWNEALSITFDRGLESDGLTGPIELRNRAGADTQLLVTDPRAADRYMAVTRWPSLLSYQSDDAAPTFTELVNGEAAVQVRTTWADGNGTGSGTSTFMIYPDGRLHRHDEISVLASSMENYLASYVSVDPAHVDFGDWEGATAPVPLDIMTGFEDHYSGTSASYACVFDSASGDLVLLAAQPQPGYDGIRLSEADRSGALVSALSFDWHRGEAVTGGEYRADFMVLVRTGSGARPCPSVFAYVTAYRSPPAMTVASPGSLAGGDPDGYHEATAAYAVSAGDAAQLALSLDAGVPSLAVHVVNVRNAHDPIVVRGDQRLVRGRDYLLHHEADGLWLFVVDGVGPSGVRLEWP